MKFAFQPNKSQIGSEYDLGPNNTMKILGTNNEREALTYKIDRAMSNMIAVLIHILLLFLGQQGIRLGREQIFDGYNQWSVSKYLLKIFGVYFLNRVILLIVCLKCNRKFTTKFRE